MWNARLDESQAGIKIASRNTNKLQYADEMEEMRKDKAGLEGAMMW